MISSMILVEYKTYQCLGMEVESQPYATGSNGSSLPIQPIQTEQVAPRDLIA